MNLSIVTLVVLAMSTSASFAATAGAGNVCVAHGSPPSGFPSCVWSIPVTGGEVLLDTVGIASASELRKARAEGRAPNLAPHVVTDEEGAGAVEALLQATGELSGVMGSELPTYELPDGDAQATVMGGTLIGPWGQSGQTAMFGVYIYDWGNGHRTIIFEFSEGNGIFYDTDIGWGYLF
ncbi:hypothetical protein HJC10_37935 [Corallococcus exiguus]|uniref:hypothetical protein n=1 Tax=Corallococcus exiguus TaxID=83462 RepID=UPI001471420D|nr:hypothetical protein [Corallococcus exiguus]NNB99682.1 hypothetical protein [Corallococcus exiguus]NNC08605.1 hypothetical protein [Corallococcus exiguus]